MTQAQFGELIGATRGQVVSYEIGESRPKGKIESEILSQFKISRESLYESKLNQNSLRHAPVHPVTIEKRIVRLETQVEMLVGLLKGRIR